MGLTAWAAYWFLPAVIPIAIFVSFSDMRRMKIPNIANDALLIYYAIIGLIALPFVDYLWHWSHFIVVLAAGILMNAVRLIGAGDAKFMAAAAPMVAYEDLRLIIVLLCACLLAAYATHRLARISPLRRMVPDWESWETGKKFPMGFPLSMSLLFYLLIVAIYR
ncbi:prepilin peptidase [Loktanella agnita]|uniref:prepilin peptidase n=1 Tax=Loktanella agnita TaxID=287097 RepID=UPI0039884370